MPKSSPMVRLQPLRFPSYHRVERGMRKHQYEDPPCDGEDRSEHEPDDKLISDSPKLVIRRSLQLGVFRLRLLEDRDVGVGVFPESEEILVGSLCLGLVSRQSERSA